MLGKYNNQRVSGVYNPGDTYVPWESPCGAAPATAKAAASKPSGSILCWRLPKGYCSTSYSPTYKQAPDTRHNNHKHKTKTQKYISTHDIQYAYFTFKVQSNGRYSRKREPPNVRENHDCTERKGTAFDQSKFARATLLTKKRYAVPARPKGSNSPYGMAIFILSQNTGHPSRM